MPVNNAPTPEFNQSQHGESTARPSNTFVRTLARYAAETVHCGRPVSQLGSWVTAPVAKQLLLQQQAAAASRQADAATARSAAPTISWCQSFPVANIYESVPGCLDCVVVLLQNQRAFAVALRLQYEHQRWRAVELAVL